MTQQAPVEQKPAEINDLGKSVPGENTPGQSTIPGLEETRAAISQVADNPPSPMPIQGVAESAGNSAEPAKPENRGEFGNAKDYKGRLFDPRLHKVKADGKPDFNRDGTLKLLPKSKRGLGETVRNLFNRPPSDHELNERDAQEAEAQARSISHREEVEASAAFWEDMYFIGGNAVLGKAFSNTRKEREKEIRGAFIRYEERTGRTFDPPPGLSLAVALISDVGKTYASEPECQERFEDIKSSVIGETVSGMVRRSLVGSFFGGISRKVKGFFGYGKKTPPAKRPENLNPQSQFPAEGNEGQ